MTGKFITLEGGEGAGKSTQAKALCAALEIAGVKTELTREPGGTPSAETIRELLLTGHEDKWNIRTEALLFAAARAEHSHKLIRPALENGTWVICDRYIDSSRAYQTVSDVLSDADIRSLHLLGSGGLMPDRTFVLDLPEDIAAKRAAARDRGDSDRIGGRDASYHRKVMLNFRSYAEAEPDRVLLIDAALPAEEITKNLLHNLSDLIN